MNNFEGLRPARVELGVPISPEVVSEVKAHERLRSRFPSSKDLESLDVKIFNRVGVAMDSKLMKDLPDDILDTFEKFLRETDPKNKALLEIEAQNKISAFWNN
jgi:hypothetical protein